MELYDASATDVKVFHLIFSANRLVLSQTIIIKAIIIVQEIDKDKISFITLRITKRKTLISYLSENDIAGQVQFSIMVSIYLYVIFPYRK